MENEVSKVANTERIYLNECISSQPARKRHRGETSKLRRSRRHTGAECRRRHQRKRSELQSEPFTML